MRWKFAEKGRLAGLNTVTYRYLRELNYPAENYLSKIGETYMLITKTNDITGFRYVYRNVNSLAIFYNSEVFGGSFKTSYSRLNTA